MAQHDYVIDNAGGAAVRSDINDALQAIITQNSGPTEPTVTRPYMLWNDTTDGALKIRNATDTAWVLFSGFALPDGAVSASKLDGGQSGSSPVYGARAWVSFNGSGTVAINASGNVSSITDNGVGDYTVNLTTAMADANYSAVITTGTSAGTAADTVDSATLFGSKTTLSFRFAVAYIFETSGTVVNGMYDPWQVNVQVIR